MKKNMNINDDELIIASCYQTLDDILKSNVAKNKHIHCQFAININDLNLLKRDLLKIGVKSISSKGIDMINISANMEMVKLANA